MRKKIRITVLAVLFCLPLLGVKSMGANAEQTHWAADAIAFVEQAGLMDGMSDYSFAPDAAASRACIVQAVYRLEGQPASGADTTFSDVDMQASYQSAVQWSAANGIITGYEDGTFRPGDALTREQMAAVLYRYAGYRGEDCSARGDLSVFDDAEQINAYAREAVSWANAQGLLTGMSDSVLSPRGTVTRAQLATILQRLADQFGLTPEADTDAGNTVQTASYTAFTTSLGPVERTETVQTLTEVRHETRRYTDTEQCVVEMGRTDALLDAPAHTAAVFHMDGYSGTVRWFDRSKNQWYEKPLEEGTLPRGMYFIRVDGVDSIVVTAQAYTAHENGMIEYLPDSIGGLTVTREDGGWSFALQVGDLPAGAYSDYLLLTSNQQLIDWTQSASLARWSNYRFTDDNRWCYDGYYYTAPSSYYPYGENYFYSLPAAHIAGKMARDAGEPASRALGLAMIDIMRVKQNEYGFIPSQAGSTWLKGDYNIDPGYYDTRFNTDFWLANLNAVETFGVTEWMDRTRVYADFLTAHAQQHHFSFGSGEDEGWLVEDYWHPNGLGKTTHASLNHHAAEAVFLYRFANYTGEESYAELADCMVRGIEHTVDLWLLPDHNLNYSYKPDGTASGNDYPSLTYNDLLDLQRLYTQRHGEKNEAIQTLMDNKLIWMTANGVKDYNK